jgi:transposase-like protein
MKGKKYPEELKQLILDEVMKGRRVADIASEYGVSLQIIYQWLKTTSSSFKYQRRLREVEKENRELKEIIGNMNLFLERFKKNHPPTITELFRIYLKWYPNTNRQLLCRYYGVSRASLYFTSRLTVKDQLIIPDIQSVIDQNPYYGYKRISWSLGINHKRVYRIMKSYDVWGKRRVQIPRKKKDAGNASLDIPNLIKDVIPTKPNHIWCSDFTYI